MSTQAWPELPYDAWKDTYATLHLWTQVVGKVALAQAPPLNHSWAIAMQVTPAAWPRGRCRTARDRSPSSSTSWTTSS